MVVSNYYVENGLDLIAREIKRRLRDNKDVVLAITGYEGSGKSTLEILMAMKVDKNFSIKRNIILDISFKKVRDKILSIDRYGATCFDEAIKQLNKSDWASGVQQNLVKYFTLFRKQNKLHIICIPSFWDLTKTFRERRVFIWIHVIDEGRALLFKSFDKSPFYAWYVSDLEKTMKKAVERKQVNPSSPNEMISVLSKSVHFQCVFPFDKLPEELEKEYLEYMNEFADSEMFDEVDPEFGNKVHNKTCLRFGKLLDLMKTGELGKKTSIARISRLIDCPARTLDKYRARYVSEFKNKNVHGHRLTKTDENSPIFSSIQPTPQKSTFGIENNFKDDPINIQKKLDKLEDAEDAPG